MKTLISYLSLAILMLTFSYAVGTQQKLNQQYEASRTEKGTKASTAQPQESASLMKAGLSGSGLLDAQNWKRSGSNKEIASR